MVQVVVATNCARMSRRLGAVLLFRTVMGGDGWALMGWATMAVKQDTEALSILLISPAQPLRVPWGEAANRRRPCQLQYSPGERVLPYKP